MKITGRTAIAILALSLVFLVGEGRAQTEHHVAQRSAADSTRQSLVDSIRQAVLDSVRLDMMRMHEGMTAMAQESGTEERDSEGTSGSSADSFFGRMMRNMSSRGHLSNMRRMIQPESSGPMKDWGAYLYTNYLRTPPDEDGKRSFNNHNLSIELSGQAGERFHYLGEFGLRHSGEFTSENEIEIEKAYVGYEFSKALTVWSGMFLIPFNRFNIYHEPPNHRLVTTPLITRLLGAVDWNDAGVLLYGRVEPWPRRSVSYFLYAVNGKAEAPDLEEGINVDNNDSPAYGGRVAFAPAEGVDIGFSYYTSKYDRRASYDLRMLGVEAQYERGDLQLYGEYARADIGTPAAFADGKAWGLFVQASYLLQDKFMPVVRYEVAKYDDPYHGEGFDPAAGTPGSGIQFDGRRLALGIALYPTEAVGLKLEYGINWRDGVRVADNTIALQAVAVLE